MIVTWTYYVRQLLNQLGEITVVFLVQLRPTRMIVTWTFYVRQLLNQLGEITVEFLVMMVLLFVIHGQNVLRANGEVFSTRSDLLGNKHQKWGRRRRNERSVIWRILGCRTRNV